MSMHEHSSVDTEGKVSSLSYNILGPTKVDRIISFGICSVLHSSFRGERG